MYYLFVIILIIITTYLLKIVFSISFKQAKEIGKNKELDEKMKKYPQNRIICEYFLRKLKNNEVKIEESKESKSCMYIVVSNKIELGDIENTYTKIQTIAHECIHSIQDKKLLYFNFFFSNLYFIFSFIIIILQLIFNLHIKNFLLITLFIMAFIYYIIRTYLENDAMIKARFLAKEYLEEVKISDENEIKKIIENYDELNKVGIKCVNYSLYLTTIIPIILFCIVCFSYNL